MNITDKINNLNKKLFSDLQELSSNHTGEFELVGNQAEKIINTWGEELAEATEMECGPPKFKVKIDTGSDSPLTIEAANDIAREIIDINDIMGFQEDS